MGLGDLRLLWLWEALCDGGLSSRPGLGDERCRL